MSKELREIKTIGELKLILQDLPDEMEIHSKDFAGCYRRSLTVISSFKSEKMFDLYMNDIKTKQCLDDKIKNKYGKTEQVIIFKV